MQKTRLQKAQKRGYCYTQVTSGGQLTLTLPKQFMEVCGQNIENRLVKVSNFKSGLFLEPMLAFKPNNLDEESLDEYLKDDQLTEKERKNAIAYLQSIARL